MNKDFNVQLSLRVFRSLHNTTVKMSEGVVLFTFCTFFIDVKVANLSEVKLYIIMIVLFYYFYCYLLFRFIKGANEGNESALIRSDFCTCLIVTKALSISVGFDSVYK